MSKFKVVFAGVEEDEVFYTREEAEEYAMESCALANEGAEIMNLSNPGDYEYDEDNYEDPDYEIIEI